MLVDQAQQINLVDPLSCFNVRPGGCVEGGRRGSHSLPFSTPAGGRLRLGHRSGVVPVGAWGTLRLVIKFVNVMYFFIYKLNPQIGSGASRSIIPVTKRC